MTYWIPDWPLGFGANPTGQNSNTYGNFPSFDNSDARGGGFAFTRYNFPNGWFVGSEGGMGLSMNGFNSLSYQGVQFGYNFQNSPLRIYGGFDTLKYNTGVGNPFAPFDAMSATLPGYSARAGVEFQPVPNVSLSLGVGYTQQPGLSGVSPFNVNGLR